MSIEDFVYSRIGMALVSVQRVEFVTSELIIHLKEFDMDIYGISTTEFLNSTPEAATVRKSTLGKMFKWLKLNPKLVLEDELTKYVEQRNILAHHFWTTYLNTKSEEQIKSALGFCQALGESSQRLESFFKGFVYFLALRHVKDRDHLSPEFKGWSKDFDYFMESLQKKELT